MITLIATRFIRYAGKAVQKDEKFTASERDAKLLVTLGRATYHVEEVEEPKPKRRYRRSDMRAEE